MVRTSRNLRVKLGAGRVTSGLRRIVVSTSRTRPLRLGLSHGGNLGTLNFLVTGIGAEVLETGGVKSASIVPCPQKVVCPQLVLPSWSPKKLCVPSWSSPVGPLRVPLCNIPLPPFLCQSSAAIFAGKKGLAKEWGQRN
jgi:hypothetical protein